MPFGFVKKLAEAQAAAAVPRCAACGARELTELAPGAYRCVACGHEGGDGYAAYQRGQRRADLARRATSELVDIGLKSLEGVRFGLAAVSGAPAPEEGSGWNVRFEFKVDPSASIGGALSRVGGLLGGVAVEEAAAQAAERIQQLIRLRAELLDLRPLLGALVDQGRFIGDCIERLEAIVDVARPSAREISDLTFDLYSRLRAI